MIFISTADMSYTNRILPEKLCSVLSKYSYHLYINHYFVIVVFSSIFSKLLYNQMILIYILTCITYSLFMMMLYNTIRWHKISMFISKMMME